MTDQVNFKGQAVQRSEGLDIPQLDDGLIDLLLTPSVIESLLKYTPLNHHYVPYKPVEASSSNSRSAQSGGDNTNGRGRDILANMDDGTLMELNGKLIYSVGRYALKAAMIYLTSFQTPAMTALGVRTNANELGKYKQFRDTHRKNHHKHIHRYVILAAVLPLIHEAIQWRTSHLEEQLNQQQQHGSSEDHAYERRHGEQQRLLSIYRKVKLLKFILRITAVVVPPLQLYHYLSYIFGINEKRGIHTPSPAMNLSYIKYKIPTRPTGNESDPLPRERSINFLYAYRRLWYDEIMFTSRLFLFPILEVWKDLPQGLVLARRRTLLQLKNYIHCARQKSKTLADKFRKGSGGSDASNNGDTLSDDRNVNSRGNENPGECAICHSHPIIIPYQAAPCGHWYCYACLRGAMIDAAVDDISHDGVSLTYHCVTCGSKVTSSRPAGHG